MRNKKKLSLKESIEWLRENEGITLYDFHVATGRAHETLSKIATNVRDETNATRWYVKGSSNIPLTKDEIIDMLRAKLQAVRLRSFSPNVFNTHKSICGPNRTW